MSREPTDKSRPGYRRKVLRVIWSGKTPLVPKAVTDKVQAFPAPANAKEVHAFVGIWGVRELSFPTWHSASVPPATLQRQAKVSVHSIMLLICWRQIVWEVIPFPHFLDGAGDWEWWQHSPVHAQTRHLLPHFWSMWACTLETFSIALMKRVSMPHPLHSLAI